MGRLSDFALNILKERCFLRDDKGEPCETPEEMFKRVAHAVSKAEENPKLQKKWEKIYYDMMIALDFLPGSPTLFNAGKERQLLSSCFVIPLEDSMDGIFGRLSEIATIQKFGGGTGMAFSNIRPRGDMVSSTHGVASGPVAFMAAFNGVTDSVKQGGMRRGANMGILKVDHPDIMEFITCKDVEGKLTNFNISVAVTDEFMELVQEDGILTLRNPRNNRTQGTMKANQLFNTIVEQMWKNGEPGVVFIDTINRKHAIVKDGMIESTNPCGEQPLLPYESCNLGSINLANMVKNGMLDDEKLIETTYNAVRMLDSVIDANVYPLDKIKKATMANRKIGLGVMGWHDFLIKLGVPYDSQSAIEYIHEVMELIGSAAFQSSQDLGEEKGVFPNVTNSKYAGTERPPRNAERITIAPTGTISAIAGVSSGIEPHYALYYKRRILSSEFDIVVDELKPYLKQFEISWKDIKKSGGTLKNVGVPLNVKKLFTTSHEIPMRWHVKHQAVFQKYVDAAVSKTINMPNDTTKEDIAKVIIMSWKDGCKGLTLYRDGSRDEQVLSTRGRIKLPSKRPDIINANVVKVVTGCGNMYVTVGIVDGQIYEVLTSMGKAGGCQNAMLESICRMISVARRSGIPVEEILDQIESIRCPHPTSGVDSQGKPVLSCPDAVAKAIRSQVSGDMKSKPEIIATCPQCGEKVVFIEGCERCSVCSWSKC